MDRTAQLLRSDAAYFRLAAETLSLPGATLFHMPEYRQIPAANVAVSDSSADSMTSFLGQIERIESAFRGLGCELFRIYSRNGGVLDRTLHQTKGYGRRLELGYFSPGASPSHRESIALSKVATSHDWAAKKSIHSASTIQADGYEVPAQEWITFEQEKCRSGLMTAYLAHLNGSAAASICTLRDGSYLRLKNLVVHPDFRRRGLATRIVHSLWVHALRQGLSGVFALAISGSPAEILYQRANFRRCGEIVEWRKSVSAQTRLEREA